MNASDFGQLPSGLQQEVRASLEQRKWWPGLCVIAEDVEEVIAANLTRHPWKALLESKLSNRSSQLLHAARSNCAKCRKIQEAPPVLRCLWCKTQLQPGFTCGGCGGFGRYDKEELGCVVHNNRVW